MNTLIRGKPVNDVEQSPQIDFSKWFQFALKWTPRTIVAGLAGYYCLGVAYEMGIMANIDRIAMRVLRPSMGYMGMAVFMPTFQWYSAWGVRITAALAAGLLYDLTERLLRIVFNAINPQSNVNTPLTAAPLHRSPSHLFPAALHNH
jgi:hypothetical protein